MTWAPGLRGEAAAALLTAVEWRDGSSTAVVPAAHFSRLHGLTVEQRLRDHPHVLTDISISLDSIRYCRRRTLSESVCQQGIVVVCHLLSAIVLSIR